MARIRAAITGIQAFAPDYILTNKELETMVDTTDEWITWGQFILNGLMIENEKLITAIRQ